MTSAEFKQFFSIPSNSSLSISLARPYLTDDTRLNFFEILTPGEERCSSYETR
jgi:hypothetical protein